MTTKLKYPFNAFISYYQTPDRIIAVPLQKSLRKLGAKWYLLKFRALEIFRDETDSVGTFSLKEKIIRGINQSEFLILLASKSGKEERQRGNSRDWVYEEIDYWLENKKLDIDIDGISTNPKIIICITDGNIKWDYMKKDFDWAITDCLPLNLMNRFVDTPQWIDFRGLRDNAITTGFGLSLELPEFKQKVAEISSQIQNISVDNLISKDRNYKQIGRVVIVGLISVLSILVIISVIFSIESNHQKRIAVENEMLANKRLVEILKTQTNDYFNTIGYLDTSDLSYKKLVSNIVTNDYVRAEMMRWLKPDDTPIEGGKSAGVRRNNEKVMYSYILTVKKGNK